MRRGTEGTVCERARRKERPTPWCSYARYLQQLLSTNRFTVLDQRESKENLRTDFPIDRKPYTNDYDYDDDSDLEEDEDWDPPNVEYSQAAPENGKSNQSDSATVVGSQSSDSKGKESPDIVSVSDMESLFSDPDDTKVEAEVPAGPTPTPAHVGTVVVIDDVAFIT